MYLILSYCISGRITFKKRTVCMDNSLSLPTYVNGISKVPLIVKHQCGHWMTPPNSSHSLEVFK